MNVAFRYHIEVTSPMGKEHDKTKSISTCAPDRPPHRLNVGPDTKTAPDDVFGRVGRTEKLSDILLSTPNLHGQLRYSGHAPSIGGTNPS